MKILASDFDLTLFVNDEDVLYENIKSINKFMKLGNIFCIITGRNYSDIKLLLNKYQIPYNYLICEDGAKIFDSTDFCVDTTMLDSSKVTKLVSFFNNSEFSYYLDDGYNNTDNYNDCVKISAEFKDKEKAIQFLEKIKKEVDVYTYLSRTHINIIDSSIDKCIALKKILKFENINENHLYVIGDAINDKEMIREFNSAIMKDHSKDLDHLGKKEYEFLYQYIEELSKN